MPELITHTDFGNQEFGLLSTRRGLVGGVPPAAGLVSGNETVRKYLTKPLVSWGVDVWEKGPGYGEDAKNPAIQCGWEEVGGR